MDGFESIEKDFKLNSELNWEPMELVKNRGNMMEGGGSGDDTSS